MNLYPLFNRKIPPIPWEEGDNIPWNDPEFSRRMLAYHLDQSTDAASRKFETIDKHVAWIHEKILKEKPSKILDLCCGPGLYTIRLTKLGHECTGIDYSPASIDHAKSFDRRSKYKLDDIRKADIGVGFDLVMMIYGEFNVFKPDDAKRILKRAQRSLNAGGKLLMEVHTFEAIRKVGEQAQSWQANLEGLFSDKPHLLLEESFWDKDSRSSTRRYFVVEGDETRSSVVTYQAYSNKEYKELLEETGFKNVEVLEGDQEVFLFLTGLRLK